MDFYGRRLATCSSDRLIKIFDINPSTGTQKHVADLKGHEGPVWQVAWAHPRFGTLLASCSYDRKVKIWREVQAGVWSVVYEKTHKGSVNALAWAPEEHGLVLACCSSNGLVSVMESGAQDGTSFTEICEFDSLHQGCNALSWAPYYATPSAGKMRRLATGGCDHAVRVWCYDASTSQFKMESVLPQKHADWVRDVAFSPSVYVAGVEMLASGGQDKEVHVWRHDVGENKWTVHVLPRFAAVVWRVAWSVTGNVLAVTTADNQVTLWREAADGEFKRVEAQSLDQLRHQE
jgi:protein transport protein SEC13